MEKDRPPRKGRGRPPRVGPTPTQIRILKALAAASEPIRTSVLEDRAGLFRTELRGGCVRLVKTGHITGVNRKVERRFQIGLAHNVTKFWSLTEKGREHVKTLDLI